MDVSGQDREVGSGLLRGLLAWALWVIASATGGAILAPIGEPLEIVGFLFLPGVVLGAAQALVLRRYLPYPPNETNVAALVWVGASFLGWLAGCIVFVLVRALARLMGVPEIAQQIGSLFVQIVGTETARTTALRIVIWAVFAAVQGVTLALGALALGHRRRTLLVLAALWVPAGAIGGALAVAVSSTVVAAAFSGGFDLFFDRILPGIVGQTTAWALYGVLTGVVFALITQSLVPREESA